MQLPVQGVSSFGIIAVPRAKHMRVKCHSGGPYVYESFTIGMVRREHDGRATPGNSRRHREDLSDSVVCDAGNFQ